jgi:cell division control protein 24
MKEWYEKLENQRKFFASRPKIIGRGSTRGISDTQYAFFSKDGIENPYKQNEEEDEEDAETFVGNSSTPVYGSEYSTLNGSTPSLRSRSATGDSGPPLPQAQYPSGGTRAPPPRFPMGSHQPLPLAINSQFSHEPTSPSERTGSSYFSPTSEAAASARQSAASSTFPFPRQSTPSGHEENNRYTAPAMGRTPSRESHGPGQTNGASRSSQRPSYNGMGASYSTQPPPMNRMRSASSPDIPGMSLLRRHTPNGTHPSEPPVPPVPSYIANQNNVGMSPNRSQNNSPTSPPMSLPVRSATQSPSAQRDRYHTQQPAHYSHQQQQQYNQYTSQPQHQQPNYGGLQQQGFPRAATHPGGPLQMQPYPGQQQPYRQNPPPQFNPASYPSNPPSQSSTPAPQQDLTLPAPTQLKVKVSFADNYVSLVVNINISYQSLIDRIDAKLSRVTPFSIGKGSLRLRYQDEDGDYITICSDEDIQMAFSDWREQNQTRDGGATSGWGMGEILLYCHES